MTKFKCKYCDGTIDMKLFVPIENKNYKKISDPIYGFHIKQICSNCCRYQAFLKQTPELMAELKDNAFLKINLEERELPFADEESVKNS